MKAAREGMLGQEALWLMAMLREQQLAKEGSRVARREEQKRRVRAADQGLAG